MSERATEKKLLTASKEIEEEGKKILVLEKKIIAEESVIIGALRRHRSTFVRKLSKHKLIFALLATVGMVLIWRGTWHTVDEIPILSYSLISLILGVTILWLIKKYTDLH